MDSRIRKPGHRSHKIWYPLVGIDIRDQKSLRFAASLP